MTHIYSVKIQNYISEQLAVAAENKKAAEKQNDFETRQFYEGQLKELLTFRKYLTEKIDLNTQEYY
jgi:hypothetical protein